MAGSAIARAGVAQDFADVICVTVREALAADTTLNRYTGGVGGLGPWTTPGDMSTRPEIDLEVGESYREGIIRRGQVSLPLSGGREAAHIVVSVWNRESPSDVGGFQGDLQIAILYVDNVLHQSIPDDQPTISGMLRHTEAYLSSKRHQRLCENAYGGDQLSDFFIGFSQHNVAEDPKSDDTVFIAFRQLVSYRTNQNQWANPPVRV